MPPRSQAFAITEPLWGLCIATAITGTSRHPIWLYSASDYHSQRKKLPIVWNPLMIDFLEAHFCSKIPNLARFLKMLSPTQDTNRLLLRRQIRSLITFSASVAVAIFTFADHHRSKPNILCITIDDLNDWVGCLQSHPQIQTPNIDRLAARGLLFTNAHCVVPACSGSRAANWTGLSPINNGVYGNGQRIEKTMPKATMLTHDLQSQGYHTMGTGKLFHGRNENYFDEYGPDYDKWMPILPDERTISKKAMEAMFPMFVTKSLASALPFP